MALHLTTVLSWWGDKGKGTLVGNVNRSSFPEALRNHLFLHSWLSGNTDEACKDGVSQVAWRFSFSLSKTQGDHEGSEDTVHPRQTQLCLRRPQQEAGVLEPLQFLL